MKKMIVLSMVLLVSSFLYSYEYIMNTNPSGIGSHTGTVQITTWTPNADDGYYDLAVPAINQFYYYGKLVTHLRIFTNGVVHPFSGSSSLISGTSGNYPIPFPGSNPNNVVAPFWDDWDLRTTGAVYYQIVQNAENNNYISIEWRGVPRYTFPTTAYSFSCAFCSANNPYRANTIIFVYADVDSGNASIDYGKDATVGIENSTGTIGEQFSFNEAILTNGLQITFTPFVPIYGSTVDHYLSDSYPDAVAWRPSDGTWYFYGSDGSTYGYPFGTKGDVALPGDYDGDGDADECVFRPSNSTWFCNMPNFVKQWGTSGDIPVPADYNGDGKMDIAVFRPSSGHWFIYYRESGTSQVVQFGTTGDIPLPADYDGDDRADFAVYRPANNYWFINYSSTLATVLKQWGTEGDIPLPGNFNTNLYATLTVFRPSNGYWFSYNQNTAATNIQQYGQDGDVPVPTDVNSGGITDAAVFRPGSSGFWFINLTNPYPAPFQWGTLGDKPRFRRSFLVVSPPPTSGGPDL